MDIVEEIRKDPENGTRRLESEYKVGLMALARRFCTDEGDAEELVNSTLAEVVASIDRYAEQSAFFAWMARILVRRHGHDTERKSNETVMLSPETVEAAADPAAETRIFSDVDSSILRDAIEGLPEDIRNTVVMHYFMGIPVREAAKVLSVPTGTVAWRLHYARMLLAAKLGATAKKPGGKALLIILALAALTAIGAAGIAAIRAAMTGNAECTMQNAECQDAFPAEGFSAADLQSGNSSTVQLSNCPTVQPSAPRAAQQEQPMNATTLRTLAAFAAATATTYANTYYLSPSGNDANDGRSEATAFQTVNKAISQVHSHDSKDELVILPGKYAATGTLSMAGQFSSNLADADVIRSSTGNPADVVIYGNGSFNLLNLARGVVVDGITFSNGVATASGVGGGVRVGSDTTDYPTLLANCVITCCGATSSGKAAGGAYVFGAGKVADSVIENCTATTGSGAAGVFLNNSSKAPTIENTVIRNCSATDCADTCAGGIASAGGKGGSERIVDCVISNCTTTGKGGGAYLSLGPSALVSGTTFALCHALRGGGVLVADGTCVFEDCSFNENSSNAGDNGGGVLSTGRASFKNCRFAGNVAGKGGAVYSTSQARTSVTGCDFSSNSADDGGAFYLTGLASASLSNCMFTLNRSGYGGAAAFEQDEGGYFAFTNCVFASNAATKYGGAVSCCRSNYSPSGSDGSNLKGMYGEFYGCTFTNNVASDCGGALFHRENNSSRNSGTPLILRNSLFAYNRVSNPGYYHCGGAIYLLSYDKPVVDACTITRNDVASGGSNQFGAGFYNRFSCSFINTIIADNTMNGVSEGANDWFRSGATITASHSCAYPAPAPYNQFTVANGCVTTDPKFADSGRGDFTLRSSSPCKDTALLEPWMANAFDIAGNARVIGNGPNMGCYESVTLKGMVIVVK